MAHQISGNFPSLILQSFRIIILKRRIAVQGSPSWFNSSGGRGVTSTVNFYGHALGCPTKFNRSPKIISRIIVKYMQPRVSGFAFTVLCPSQSMSMSWDGTPGFCPSHANKWRSRLSPGKSLQIYIYMTLTYHRYC